MGKPEVLSRRYRRAVANRWIVAIGRRSGLAVCPAEQALNADQDMQLQDGPARPDLSLCELEPIHTPGAIQPHGAVVVAHTDGLAVSHASANLEAILGRSAEAALGVEACMR